MADTLIHRWSQRKSQPQPNPPAAEPSQSTAEKIKDAAGAADQDTSSAAPDAMSNQAAGETHESKPEPIELPSLDSLDENSDYSAFMAEGVDEKIKKLALRKLFKSAVFNIRDGLDDYDDDFTAFEELGDIVTSDMKFQQQRLAAEKEQAERDAAAQTAADEPVSEKEPPAEASAAVTGDEAEAAANPPSDTQQAAADSSAGEEASDPAAKKSDAMEKAACSGASTG